MGWILGAEKARNRKAEVEGGARMVASNGTLEDAEDDVDIVEGGQIKIKGVHFQRQQPHGGVGLAIGCFAGAGYGFSIGFGMVSKMGRTGSFVRPSRTPFAYEGALTGGFCGITVGTGVGAGLARGLGYAWRIDQILPSRLWGGRENSQHEGLSAFRMPFGTTWVAGLFSTVDRSLQPLLQACNKGRVDHMKRMVLSLHNNGRMF